MNVLEHESVLAIYVATARAAVSNIVSNHRLQLESDVLHDVRRIGAVTQANDESAVFPDAAPVLVQTGHRFYERVGKAIDVS
jgi:hypothetical protein